MSRTIASGGITDANGRTTDAMHLIQTQTASSSSEIDFVLPSGYSRFTLSATNVVPASDGEDLQLLTSSDGGSNFDTGTSDYEWQRTEEGTASDDNADAQIVLVGSVGNGTNEGASALEIKISAHAETVFSNALWDLTRLTTTGSIKRVVGSGRRQENAIIDAVRIKFSSGNIASGKFYLHGWV